MKIVFFLILTIFTFQQGRPGGGGSGGGNNSTSSNTSTTNTVQRQQDFEFFATTCSYDTSKDWRFAFECVEGYVAVLVHSRARNGFLILALSPSTETFVNATILISKYSGRYVLTDRLQGRNNTNLKGLNFTKLNDTLWIPNEGAIINEYPFGLFIDDVYSIYFFNQSLFLNKFQNNFYVKIAYSHDGPAELGIFYDSKMISGEVSFNYSFVDSKSLYVNSVLGPLGALLLNIRIENTHLSLYIIVLIIIFTTLILCIIFYRHQPLRSRGLFPILSNIILLIYYFASIPILTMNMQKIYDYICIPIYYFQVPSILALIYLYAFQYFRYIILTNENKRKKFVILQKNSDQAVVLKVPWYYKVLNFFGKNWMILINFIVLFSIIICLYLIINLFQGYQCNQTLDFIGMLLQYIITMVAVGLFFILFIFDVILNIDKLKKCKLLEFWKEDVFYMRLELFFGYIQMILFSTLVFIFNFVKVPFFTFIIPFMIFNSLRNILLFIQFSLFSLFITIIKLIMKCVKKTPDEDFLTKILEDPYSNQKLQEFSIMEFSPENIQLYNDIQKYHKMVLKEDKRNMLNQIYKMYLNGSNSSLEVNLPSSMCTPILFALDHPEEELPENIFSEIQRSTIVNISDTFSRFILSNEFLEIKKKDSFIKGAFGTVK